MTFKSCSFSGATALIPALLTMLLASNTNLNSCSSAAEAVPLQHDGRAGSSAGRSFMQHLSPAADANSASIETLHAAAEGSPEHVHGMEGGGGPIRRLLSTGLQKQGRSFGQADVSRKEFVFVYDFGPKFSTEPYDLRVDNFPEAFASEKLFLDLLLRRNVTRTFRPERANLFFVPFSVSRFLLHAMQERNVRLRAAMAEASAAFEGVMRRVRESGPWFGRNNGRDHFGLISHDHGRCSLLSFVTDSSVYGDMFFLQFDGDKVLRSRYSKDSGDDEAFLSHDSEPHAAAPSTRCYLPDRDIVIPPFLASHALPLVSPFDGNRPITALLRFSKYFSRDPSPGVFFNHNVRYEIYRTYEELEPRGWEFGPRSEEKTQSDMRQAVFCICPPGHAQWTARVVAAILSGCIPVTFFRDNDNPWQDEIDYGRFSVNIDPQDVPLLKPTLDSIIQMDGKLVSMQTALQSVQMHFCWRCTGPSSLPQLVLHSLFSRACLVGYYHQILRC